MMSASDVEAQEAAVAQVVGWLVLLVGLAISIGAHELGHMIPAKRFGVRVPRYMIGFGPTLWSTRRGETEYGVKAIPLGGYTKLVGMLPPPDAVDARPGTGAIARLVQEAREASAEEILPGEDHRAFYRLSVPKKVVVMAGGILANLLMAVLLLVIVLSGIGTPTGSSTTVSEVGECQYPVGTPTPYTCTADDPATPGAVAGIRPGDRLVSFDGKPIETWADFTGAVADSRGGDLPLVVERDGAQVTLTVSPADREWYAFDDKGNVIVDDNGDYVTRATRFVGISPAAVTERQPLTAVAPVVGQALWESGSSIVNLPVSLWKTGVALVGGGEREAGVISLVGVGQVAGQIASDDGPGVTVAGQVAQMLLLVASLNVALFMFNLLPLVPLDGGHVVGALWEGAKRQWARARGLPRPLPADTARMMPLAYGVFVLFGAMTLFLVVADVLRPVSIG